MNELPPWLREMLTRSDWLARALQGALALTSGFGALQGVLKDTPVLAALSIAVVVLIMLWVVGGVYLRRQRAQPALLAPTPRSSSSYLRGLLPFERDERLLGRDQDVGQLLALVRALDYRVGFLSGEAGAGKTSLLRARVVPELEKDNKRVLYVARVGGDPLAAIRMQINRMELIPAKDSDEPIIGLLEKLAKANGTAGSLFIVLDQFEEFFVTRRTKRSIEAFESFLRKLALQSDVRLLFALRKEFVDDLLDFGSAVANLAKWRLPLRNLDPEIARLVIGEVAKAESLPFSAELQDLVVADLTQAQRVRPVEFQLVFTTLLNQRVHDRPAYEAIGGAKGVIARFIGEIIAPPEFTISEAERAVARHTLRALCDKDFTTRRPTGLTRGELLERVQEELPTGIIAPVVPGEVEPALTRVLERFLDAFVLIREDEERFNLAHDYLASPIRDATADIETVEETATRLLEQLLQQNREFGGVMIPWRKLRYILRYASRDVLSRTETGTLVRRTRQRQIFVGATAAVVALLLATVVLPLGTHYINHDALEIAGRRVVSENGRVVLAFDDDGASIVRLNGERLSAEPLGVGGAQAAVFSPDGTSALVFDKKNKLHRFWIGERLSHSVIIDDLGWRGLRQSMPFGFSRDGTMAYAVAVDGRVFAWPANGTPHLVTRLTSLPDPFDRPILTGQLPDPKAEWSEQPYPPKIYITPDGSRLAVIDGTRRLFLLPSAGANIQPGEVVTVDRETELLGDRSSKWLVYGSEREVAAIDLLDQEAAKPNVIWENKEKDIFSGNVRSSISASGWLVWRSSFDDFHGVDLNTPGPSGLDPAIDLERSSHDMLSAPVFSEEGGFAAGTAQDGHVYAWPLSNPPRATAKPLLSGPDEQRASFCPTSAKLMISAGDGGLYFTDLLSPNPVRQVGRLASANVKFHFEADGSNLIAYDEYRIASGTCGGQITTITELPSRVLGVEVDPAGYLVVLSEKELVRIDRTFLLWGLPIWHLGWPALAAQDGYAVVSS